jgi:hypothetical protein
MIDRLQLCVESRMGDSTREYLVVFPVSGAVLRLTPELRRGRFGILSELFTYSKAAVCLGVSRSGPSCVEARLNGIHNVIMQRSDCS